MRYPIYGVVAPSTSITVYNDDGVTPATIYAAASGGSALVGSIVTADSKGNVVFWVDDGDDAMIYAAILLTFYVILLELAGE